MTRDCHRLAWHRGVTGRGHAGAGTVSDFHTPGQNWTLNRGSPVFRGFERWSALTLVAIRSKKKSRRPHFLWSTPWLLTTCLFIASLTRPITDLRRVLDHAVHALNATPALPCYHVNLAPHMPLGHPRVRLPGRLALFQAFWTACPMAHSIQFRYEAT